MFKKKPNIKPLAPLRSSDRRKIADQIIQDFGIEVPKQEDSLQPDGEVEATQPALTLSALRNSLLPDNALSARFTTTQGADLKQVSGTIYAGQHPGDDQRILWFKMDERLTPTVYTLWRHPRLVPLLHTQDFVIRKLQGGSPLMTPGLARGPPFPEQAIKGAIVAIASVQYPSVPLVVGICEIDVSALRVVQGQKGHAVRSEHWEGDELWGWSTGGKPGGSAPERIDGWDRQDGGQSLEPALADLTIDDTEEETEEGGVALTNGKSKQHNDHVEGEDMEPFERIEEKEMSTQDIDHAFWQAFLYGVQTARNKTEDKNHGLSYPIPQSLVMSSLVLPYLPTFTPAQEKVMTIKKTSWKNAKKFIKALQKAKLVQSKDRDGGECVVLDIDFEDPAVLNFVPYRLPKKETKGDSTSTSTNNTSSSDISIGQTLKLIILYRPKDSLSPIFSASNASTKALYLPTELRPIVTSYLESENLLSSTNKRLISLNPILANAVFDANTPLDNQIIAKGTVPRDALIDRILQSCSPFWALLRNDETRDSVKAKVGHAPKIHIVLETRSGNKMVTKISGVEIFHVNPQALAEELQKACASSTSVGRLEGSSPKTPVMEVLVQGPQKEAVVKALEKRGVNRQWVEIMDKTKGKKKT